MESEKKISAASACRRELAAVLPKSTCCRRAMLGGLLANATLDTERIICTFSEAETADAAAALLQRTCSCRCTPFEVRQGARRVWMCDFTSRRAAAWLVHLRGSQTLSVALAGICPGCIAAFVRGIFLCAGTLTSPEKGHHFELLLREPSMVVLANEALTELGYPPKSAVRARGTGLYLKDSGSIEELLATLGATRTVFACINAKILREIRNQENRASNCDAGNIKKSVSATGRQIEAIHALRDAGQMDKLDEELRRTAALREQYPELSLGDLGLRMSPPISKSGMYHRMDKLLALARALTETDHA